MALTDGSRQRTIPSAAQGISGPCADIVDPSKPMTRPYLRGATAHDAETIK